MAFIVLMGVTVLLGFLALAWMKYDDMHTNTSD